MATGASDALRLAAFGKSRQLCPDSTTDSLSWLIQIRRSQRFITLSSISTLFHCRWLALLLFSALTVGSWCHAADSDWSLRTTDGQNFRLSEHRGELVVLGFWARWCGDCRQAMQALDSLGQKYGRAGVLTMSLNVGDSLEQAASMGRSLGLTMPILVDSNKLVASQFNLNRMPLIVIIDRDGVVRFTHAGFQRGDDAVIAEQLRQLIND